MKIIKFRVYDKLFDKMCYFKDTNDSQKTSYVITLDGKLLWLEENLTEDTAKVRVYLPEQYDLMQYTGLLDRHGKEIYEGDIFDCIYKFDGCNEHKLEVVWDETSASFRLKSHRKCHQPYVAKIMSDLGRLEIIGNIYENPELKI